MTTTNNNKPLITVVVPCFNHAQYLESSLDSLLIQTYENLEIIIVNDGSSDNTTEIAERYVKFDKSRVKFINLSENKGKWFCLNKAIESCKGQFVTCHDADDIALMDRIMRQYHALKVTKTLHNLCCFESCYSEEEMQAKKNTRFLSNSLQIIDKDTISETVRTGFYTPGINHYYTGQVETAGVSAFFFKDLWDVGFRFNPPNMGLRIRMSEDSDFNTRLTLALGATSVLQEKIYLYRRNTSTNKEER